MRGRTTMRAAAVSMVARAMEEEIAATTGNKSAMPTPAVEPADVSNAVLFLLSDESRYVTGLEFKVDAGVTIN